MNSRCTDHVTVSMSYYTNCRLLSRVSLSDICFTGNLIANVCLAVTHYALRYLTVGKFKIIPIYTEYARPTMLSKHQYLRIRIVIQSLRYTYNVTYAVREGQKALARALMEG